MLPTDPAAGQGGATPARSPRSHADIVPARALARGGTVVRPGAVAWGGSAGTRDGAYSSCDAVEQALSAVAGDAGRMSGLLDELARARVWVPLPAGRRPVTDGSAVALPTVTYQGAEFVPSFTSVQRLAGWAIPSRRDGAAQQHPDPSGEYPASGPQAPCIVVPAAALARRLPPDVGIALNPGAGTSVPLYPEAVARLGAAWPAAAGDGTPVRMGPPPAEPEDLLREVRSGLHGLPDVRTAAHAWLSVPGQGEGLVISVALDDPASPAAHEAVVGAIERAVAAVPQQAPFPIDVTFPGEAEPDLVDDWVAKNAAPFYRRG